MESKICLNCETSFNPNSAKQVCCSQKCNLERWRKLNPEKVKKQQKRNDAKRKGKNRYNPEVRKAWYQKKKENPNFVEKQRKQQNLRAKKIRDFINEFKISKGCKDCGYDKHPVALDFDHVSGKKEFNVCNSKSIAQAKKEIKKCEVVCSNCHRIRTIERLNSLSLT